MNMAAIVDPRRFAELNEKRMDEVPPIQEYPSRGPCSQLSESATTGANGSSENQRILVRKAKGAARAPLKAARCSLVADGQ
jgi:hypothetical protein